ncbi:ABC transporter permease [Halobacillus locisalis]|uniref:ABC transporter permease n=1 Tax=Halobacillus locisalis TaxID=220753 RepID=A0A838CVE7_9BACI|nr:ABC transporter permease [Halobacillus locisalis]MBA2175883.1 ABC transporter permease [Halobacillus locisalis]
MWTIAMKDLRLRWKDKRGLITMLLMPILLTAILGSALGGNFGEDSSMPDTVVGVAFDEVDQMTDQWVNEVLPNDEVTVTAFENGQELEVALQEKAIDVGVVLPENWGQQMSESEVKVWTDPEKTIQASIVHSMLTSFVDRIQSVSATANVFAFEMGAEGGVDVESATEEVMADLRAVAGAEGTSVRAAEEGQASLTGMQYYAAAMGVMFILFNATIGARSVLEERHTQTLARIAMTPIRPFPVMVGKFLGTLFYSLLQFLLFLIATYLFFDVSWGESPGQVLAVGVAYGVAVSGLAMMLASVIKEEKTIDAVGGIGVQVLALLGGSMIPIAAFPDILQTVSNAIPNKWALDGFISVMTGTTWTELILPTSLLLAFGLLCLWMGSMRLKLQ